mmetsp:Transcript_86980/g.153792  ORF Transcript_86980/g.153792 Transcript_86980/m.153792 type:complete len:120 (-) Transcript_86980:70-429(-)
MIAEATVMPTSIPWTTSANRTMAQKQSGMRASQAIALAVAAWPAVIAHARRIEGRLRKSGMDREPRRPCAPPLLLEPQNILRHAQQEEHASQFHCAGILRNAFCFFLVLLLLTAAVAKS